MPDLLLRFRQRAAFTPRADLTNSTLPKVCITKKLTFHGSGMSYVNVPSADVHAGISKDVIAKITAIFLRSNRDLHEGCGKV